MICKIINWIRFGQITSKIKETINGIVAEEEFYGRRKKIIGYWAYGYFDPNLPYQGRNKITRIK